MNWQQMRIQMIGELVLLVSGLAFLNPAMFLLSKRKLIWTIGFALERISIDAQAQPIARL
jgi:hypothetical protein